MYRQSISENIKTTVFLMGKWHYYPIYLTFAFLFFIEYAIANNFLLCVPDSRFFKSMLWRIFMG